MIFLSGFLSFSFLLYHTHGTVCFVHKQGQTAFRSIVKDKKKEKEGEKQTDRHNEKK